jgi:hypothetical protein
MSRIKWNLVGKIWIQNVGDIDFKVISAAENSNKFQKTRFWKEKSVEDVVTLEGLPFNSSMISFHFWLFKKLIHTWQNNVHLLSGGVGSIFFKCVLPSHLGYDACKNKWQKGI